MVVREPSAFTDAAPGRRYAWHTSCCHMSSDQRVPERGDQRRGGAPRRGRADREAGGGRPSRGTAVLDDGSARPYTDFSQGEEVHEDERTARDPRIDRGGLDDLRHGRRGRSPPDQPGDRGRKTG